MSDIKPLGSERLQGVDKIKRILEIASYNEKKQVQSNDPSTTEYVLNLSDGNQYQIVKEKSGYVIKRTINESETDYIDKLENRKFYKSYSQALRRLNLMAKEYNTLFENKVGTELFSEQKKYFLKSPSQNQPEVPSPEPAAPQPAPAPLAEPAATAPQPAPDMGMQAPPSDMGMEQPAVEPEMGMSEPNMGDEDMAGMDEMPDQGDEDLGAGSDEEGSEEVSLKSIQKLVGKLAQKLRTISKKDDEIDSKDIKYVINSVLSAVDLQKLEDEDKEEILGRFEGEEQDLDNMDDDQDNLEMDSQDTEPQDMDVEPPKAPKSEKDEIGEENEGLLGDVLNKSVMNHYSKRMHPFHKSTELDETDMNAVEGILDELFTESKVDKVLSKYFVLSESEKRNIKIKRQKVFSEINRLSESVDQELVSKKIVQKNPDVKFIGKTNIGNLVFEHKNKKFKVNNRGKII